MVFTAFVGNDGRVEDGEFASDVGVGDDQDVVESLQYPLFFAGQFGLGGVLLFFLCGFLWFDFPCLVFIARNFLFFGHVFSLVLVWICYNGF